MATIRLVPSTYSLSNTSYLSVTNADNMYNNTDNSTYATVTNSRTSTTAYYIYLKGFNFSDIPEDAVVTGFTVKVKVKQSGVSTSTTYRPYLVNNTSTITGSCDVVTTSEQVLTFTGVTADWETIKGYGSNFGIRLCNRRSSRNTTSYLYIYGAEILVDYYVPIYHNVTTSKSGAGTIIPEGTDSVVEGTDFNLIITPDDGIQVSSVTDNGVDVTDLLEPYTVAGGSFELYPAAYATSGSISGTYYQGAVGKSAEYPNTSTGNCYCSSSGQTAYISYTFDMSTIPENGIVKSVTCRVNAKSESSTNSSETAEAQLYCGTVPKGKAADFKQYTTATTLELDCGDWTIEELNDLSLRFTIGYYGGNLRGATLVVELEDVSGKESYIYTFDVDSDHNIAVVFGKTQKLYAKDGGVWKQCSKAYKKVDGTWQLHEDISQIFEDGMNYKWGK